MLVLSRKPNQKIVFPALGTSVQVLSIKGTAVRIGIEAPPGLTVLREEILPGAGVGHPAGMPFHPGRTAPDSAADPSVLRMDAALAELARLSAARRAALPADAAHALAEVEAQLRALRRRLAEPSQPGAPAARQGRRALLVEDNPNERELLATFLRLAGLDVDTAGDGADALGYLATHACPDVVLLDMGLPRCDGPTAVRAIRHDPALADVKIVAVTGHSADEYDLPRGPGGVDCWFRKPVDPAVLVQELDRELAGRGGR
jgi:carbon storage regulator CsrA